MKKAKKLSREKRFTRTRYMKRVEMLWTLLFGLVAGVAMIVVLSR